MPETQSSEEEMDQHAQDLYDNQIRPLVETEENTGKLIVLDAETGEYEMDSRANSLAMTRRMLAKHSNPILYQFRIGYDAVDAFGGFRPMPTKR